jgi:hypothetical protein
MKRFLFAVLLLASLSAFAQKENTYYVQDFPGNTVSQKLDAAQAQCAQLPSSVKCILIFGPTLANFGQGTTAVGEDRRTALPARCSNCQWIDYETTPPTYTPPFPTGGGGSGCALTMQAAVDYYVSNSGSDAAAGTSGAPFQTIQHAIDQIPPCVFGRYIIHLAAGTYAGFEVKDRVFANSIPVLPTNLYAPWSDGIGDDTTSYSWIEIKGSTAASENYIISGTTLPLIAIDQANVSFRGVLLKNTVHSVLEASNRSNVNFAGVIFTECGDNFVGATCVHAAWGTRIHLDRSGTIDDDGFTVMRFAPVLGNYQFGFYLHDGATMDDADWQDATTNRIPVIDVDLNSTTSAASAGTWMRVYNGSFVNLYAEIDMESKSTKEFIQVLNSDISLNKIFLDHNGTFEPNGTAIEVDNSRLGTGDNGTWRIDGFDKGISLARGGSTSVTPIGNATRMIYYAPQDPTTGFKRAPGADDVRSATVTLTNAQIKALPTTGVTLVDAPGPGLAIIADVASTNGRAHLLGAFTAAYTNVDAGVKVGFCICSNPFAAFSGPSSTYDQQYHTFFTSTGNVWSMVSAAKINGISVATGTDTATDIENKPLVLYLDNSAAGNLTGGNAANTLKVTVYYTIVPTN